MCDLSRALGDMSLPDSLERIYSLCVFLPDLHNFSKAAFSYDLQQIKGLNCERFVSNWFEVYFEMERPKASCGAVPLVRGVLYEKVSLNVVRQCEK